MSTSKPLTHDIAKLQLVNTTAGSKGSQKAWESGVGGSFKRPATKAPVDVMTYDDSSSGQVAPVSAASAEAAFKEACGNSFQRREDVVHPASHVGKSGTICFLLLCFLLFFLRYQHVSLQYVKFAGSSVGWFSPRSTTADAHKA